MQAATHDSSGFAGQGPGGAWRPGLQAPLDCPTVASRILIADDHAMLRLGMRAVLQGEPNGVEIIEAGCLQDAMDIFQAQQPIELVLLDLNMADCRGLQGLKRFKEAFPDARIAVFSGTQDEFVIRQARALGACAYIPKSYEPTAMSQLIVKLARGVQGRHETMKNDWSGFPSVVRSSSYDRVAELGARHLEILDLVLFGCSNQEISNSTGLSLGTIKNYVSTILLALDVKSRSHLISLFR